MRIRALTGLVPKAAAARPPRCPQCRSPLLVGACARDMIGGMGDDQRTDAPSLEAPSLGRLFGRRKARTSEDTVSAVEPARPAGPVVDEPRDAEPVPVEPADSEQTTVIEPLPTPALASAPAHGPTGKQAYDDAAVARGPRTPEAATSPKASRATLTVSGRAAAALTGLVIGLLVVVLTVGSLELCESVRGVSSCGGGPGFALLVAVAASMVALGGLMLRLARVPDPTSTSFLAVGLVCVLSLLFLIDVLDEWWMILVIPAISTLTFLLSHWVTTAVVDADA